MQNKERLVGIDIIKIICALLIFGRHAIRSGGCYFYLHNYLMDPWIIGLTGTVMIMFFMMSGYSIQYIYGGGKLLDDGLSRYYCKRIIALIPMYFFVHIVSSLFGWYDIDTVIRLFPVETIGIQARFGSLFEMVHNGGTWFVSCLLVAYFVYPLIACLLRNMKLKTRIFVLVILVGMRIYSLYTILYFGGDIYASPLFRTVDFSIGVVLCSIRSSAKRKFNNWNYGLMGIISVFILCKCFINRGAYLAKYAYIPLCFLLYCVASITQKEGIFKTKKAEIIVKIICYASSLSYAFYILQSILWRLFFAILDRYPLFEENDKRCLLAFGLLFFSSLILHEFYEKPLKKVLLKCYEKYERKRV